MSQSFRGSFEWFGVFSFSWKEDGITAEVVETDVVIANIPTCVIVRDKDAAIANDDRLWEEYLDSGQYLFYTDGSSSRSRSGAGFVCYEQGFRDNAQSCSLPGDWCAPECEICGSDRALSTVYDWRPITIFMDYLQTLLPLQPQRMKKRHQIFR